MVFDVLFKLGHLFLILLHHLVKLADLVPKLLVLLHGLIPFLYGDLVNLFEIHEFRSKLVCCDDTLPKGV